MSSQFPYTCVSCSLAFSSADQQRTHFATDLHRYNAKRRVANLPAVTPDAFNAKVLEKRTLAEPETEKLFCECCNKSFRSSGAQTDHLNSKKHKEQQVKTIVKAFTPSAGQVPEPGEAKAEEIEQDQDEEDLPEGDEADLVDAAVERRLKHAITIPENTCLFCPRSFQTFDVKMSHMHRSHGFFVPDREYLVDEQGLVGYLANVVAAWNVCIVCGLGFGGKVELKREKEDPALEHKRARRGLEAVRKHMCDKMHCKLPWDTEEDRLEFSDFYDFTKSYDDDAPSGKGKGKSTDWEDVEDEEMDGDEEVVSDFSDDDELPKQNGVRYGDSDYELVLPSGKRIGHRALRTIYKQNLIPAFEREDNEKNRLVAKMADYDSKPRSKSNALIHTKQGDMQVANAGEARIAKQNQSFKEMRDRDRAFTHHAVKRTGGNAQKHYRDMLLQ